MQSNVKNVGDYIKEGPEKRQPALIRLRQICLNILEDYEETMQYGMPTYHKVGSEPEIGFASQKNYISVYVLKENVLDQYRKILGASSIGKGCIRYRNPEKIKFDVLEQVITDSFHSDAEIC